MTKAKAITAQLVNCLEQVTPSNGYATHIKNIYTNTSTAPDRAEMPCALVRVESDICTEMVGTQATRERTFNIEIVFKRGASQDDLDDAHFDVLRSFGFGKYAYEREIKGLATGEQEAAFEFAAQGSNFTTVTITVPVTYVEDYT